MDLRSVFDGAEENSTAETPLHFAVSRNNIEIAQVLIDDVRAIHLQRRADSEGDSEDDPLGLIDHEDADAASSKTSPYRGILDKEDACGHTPFFVAVIKGHLEMAELLLADEMSDVDHPDGMEDTPLHWAILLNSPRMVTFLLRNGADRQRKSRYYGNNPVMIACLNSKADMLRILLTPAVRSGQEQARGLQVLDHQRLLYDRSAPTRSSARDEERARIGRAINAPNRTAMTSLHAACLSGNVQMVGLLLRNGADMLQKKDVSSHIPR